MNNTISIIVPCYNVEKYVGRCLESILSQTYVNLEVIVVNDGSTDGTKEALSPFLSDKRIKYIEQQNSGVSAARNAGIAAASGEYIGFVDADDYIEPQMYERLYQALTEADADVSVCNFNLVYEDGKQQTQYAYSRMPQGTLSVHDDVYRYWALVCAAPRPNNYLWSRLYKRDIIAKSGLSFEKFIQCEDTLFTFKLLPYLKKVCFLTEGYYNYFQRADSLVHTSALECDLASLYADTFQSLADYYKDNGFYEFLSILPLHAYTRLRSVFFYSRLGGLTDEKIIQNLKLAWKDRDIYKYLTGALR